MADKEEIPQTVTTSEDELRAQIRSELIPVITEEVTKEITVQVEAESRVKIAKEMNALRVENDQKIRKAVDEYMLAWKEEQKPLTQEEIQLMLGQEYAEFTVKIPFPDGAEKEFKIRELPQEAEKRFYEMAKDKLLDKAQELSALTFKITEGDVASKIKSLIEMFEPTFDILAESASISLNPKGKNEITTKWVQENLGSHRILMIVLAQVEANKLRDFFLQLFRNSRKFSMTSPVDAQASLQQQVG